MQKAFGSPKHFVQCSAVPTSGELASRFVRATDGETNYPIPH
jgi:hypothetical protein